MKDLIDHSRQTGSGPIGMTLLSFFTGLVNLTSYLSALSNYDIGCKNKAIMTYVCSRMFTTPKLFHLCRTPYVHK
jgi:hypothetical protein